MIEPDTLTKIEELPSRIASEIKTRYYEAHQKVYGRYYDPEDVPMFTACYLAAVAGLVGTINSGPESTGPLGIIFGLCGLAGILWLNMKQERKWSDTSDDPAVEIEDDPEPEQEGSHV